VTRAVYCKQFNMFKIFKTIKQFNTIITFKTLSKQNIYTCNI
jgi:hypothetical protein